MERKLITRKMNKDIPRFFKMKVFQQVGSILEQISFGEDLDYKNRALEKGFTYSVVDDKILHDEEATFLSLIQKSYYYGKTSKPPIQKVTRKKYYANYTLLNKQFLFNIFYYFFQSPFLVVLSLVLRGLKIFCFGIGFLTKKKLHKRKLFD